MATEIKGDLDVCRTVNVARRVNQGLNAETITAAEQLEIHSAWWQSLSAAAGQDVILPDATTLTNGWQVVVCADGAAALDVKTFDGVTPVSLQVTQAGDCYEYTLIDNGTAAGTWNVNYLTAASMTASSRYVENFNATTDWGAAVGGIYTQTITQATHGRGTSPQVDLFETSGLDFIKVEADIKVLANGDVEITVPETPDCRFAGKAVFV